VAEMVREGKMRPEEVHDSPIRSQLSQALGAPFPIQPEYSRYTLINSDLVLLCSDGLWDMLGDQEIREFALKAVSLEEAGQNLIAKANAAGGEDNITVVLFRTGLFI
jgi:protein phosphatase